MNDGIDAEAAVSSDAGATNGSVRTRGKGFRRYAARSGVVERGNANVVEAARRTDRAGAYRDHDFGNSQPRHLEDELPGLTYLNGTLLFVGGLAIVHAHNVWVRAWPVLLTLVGWLAMATGLFRMFAPKAAVGGENAPTYAVIAAICAVGVVFTIQAYGPSGPSS